MFLPSLTHLSENFCHVFWLGFQPGTSPLRWAGNVVGIVTGYRLDGPGVESWWGRDFPQLSGLALGPTQSPVQWVPCLSRG